MRSLLVLALVLIPATAAAHPPDPAPRLDTQIGFGLGIVNASHPGPQYGDRGTQFMLAATVSYVMPSGLAVVVDGALLSLTFSCYADAPCYGYTSKRSRMISAGLRWYANPGFYLQGLLGAAQSVFEPDETYRDAWWSPGGSLAIGGRHQLRGAFLGLELRATAWHSDEKELTIASGSALFSVGRAW